MLQEFVYTCSTEKHTLKSIMKKSMIVTSHQAWNILPPATNEGSLTNAILQTYTD